MNLTVQPKINARGQITDKASEYIPNDREKVRLTQLNSEFTLASTIRNSDYEEFGGGSSNNALSLELYLDKMQKRYNNNIPLATTDPKQQWRANTIRPMTRNKVISIVAHITSSILYPTVVAQNEESEEDKAMSVVMRDCVEWACEQSKYEDVFLSAIIDMCVNPAIILYQDYAKVMRKVKEIQKDGSWTMQEIVDEIYSGFVNEIVPCDELYISNIYEPNIQKQPFLIRRQVIGFEEAKSKYGENENFEKYVRAGLRIFFSEDDQLFYEQYDDQLQERLVEEITYYNRGADLELRVINGVLLDDPDRPLQRKDKKYPFAKSFYEQFNSRFFYGMPLVAKMMPDQDVVDTLYNMAIDGTFLQIMPPTAIFGSEEIDSSVFIPGSTTQFRDPKSRVEPIANGGNLNAGLNMLQKVENSAGESSQDPLQSGQQQNGDRTKYEVTRLEQNARTVLGLTGKMVAHLVRDFGELLVGSIVQFVPVAEVSEIIGDDIKLRFPTIILPKTGGREKSKQIDFTKDMPKSEEEQKAMEFEMLKKEGFNPSMGKDSEKVLTKVNPTIFRRMKYLVKVEPDFVDRTTKFFKKIQLYDRAIGNPLANQEAIYRDFLLGAYVPGEEDKYVMKKEDMQGDQQGQILNQLTKGGAQAKIQPSLQEQI